MKKIFFLVTFSISAFIALSQTTYKGSFIIKDLADNSKLEFYTTAIENSDFEKYRLQNTDVTLIFRNGFELQLISAQSLKVKDQKIVVADYKENVESEYKYPEFKVSDEGIIVTMHHVKPTKQQIKLNSIK